MLHVQNNLQRITKDWQSFLTLNSPLISSWSFLIFWITSMVSYERRSVNEVNATNQAETSSDMMSTDNNTSKFEKRKGRHT